MHTSTVLPRGTERNEFSSLVNPLLLWKKIACTQCCAREVQWLRKGGCCLGLCSKRTGEKKKRLWVWLALALAFLHSKLSEAQSESKKEHERQPERARARTVYSVWSFWLACRKDHVSNTQKLRRMQTPGKSSSSLSESEIKFVYI